MIVYLLFTSLFTAKRKINAIVYWFTGALFTPLSIVNNRYKPAPILGKIVYLIGKLGRIVYRQVNNLKLALFTSSLLVNNLGGWL
jgi:hypothetical protein